MSYFILIILLFQSAFNRYLNISIIDEVVSLGLCLYFIYRKYYRHMKISRDEKKAMLCIYLFYLIGAISTFVFNYQKNIFYGLESGLFSCKAFLSFFGAKALFDKCKIQGKGLIKFLHFIEGVLVLSSILLIIHRIYPIFKVSGYKLGIATTSFIFEHGTDLMCFSILLLMLSLYIRKLFGLKKKFYLNYIPAIILALNAINYKGLAFYSLLILVMAFLPYVKKFKLKYLVIFVPFILFLVMDQIEYYSNLSSSRGALIYYSFVIANNHFPFGAGFATFGTEFSRKIYSPLYSIYGLNNIWGLSIDNSSFITDTMWSGIIGETGYFGFVVILMFFVYIFRYLSKQRYLNKDCIALQYLLMIYGLIECFGDSIFMSARGVTIFILLAFFISISRKVTIRGVE